MWVGMNTMSGPIPKIEIGTLETSRQERQKATPEQILAGWKAGTVKPIAPEEDQLRQLWKEHNLTPQR